MDCPTCRKELSSEKGMKIHHAKAHNESLVIGEASCKNCGEEFTHSQDRDGIFCSRDCYFEYKEENGLDDEHKEAISEGVQEVSEQLSEAHTGKTLSEEHKQKVSEGLKEYYEDHDGPWKGVTGEDAPRYGSTPSEETRQKIRENGSPGRREAFTVDETGHTVKSGWEAEVDKMLHSADISYEYEPVFELSDRRYYPDFQTRDIVIEVKGWVTDMCEERAKRFIDENPDLTYVVVGSEIPHDIHIEWNNRKKLMEVVR
jgi:hypothetical protein